MRRGRTWNAAAVGMAAGALLLAACGSSSPTSTKTPQTTTKAQPATTKTSGTTKGVSVSSVRIGFILKPISNPYFATMEQGAAAEAKKLGVHLTTEDASSLSDATGQANALSALIAHGYSCYLVNPVDATNLVQPLTQVQHGRPIVNIDLPMSLTAAKAAGVHIDSYIGTNNVAAGKLSADELAKLLPHDAEVAIIGGLASDPTSQARIKGFTEGAAGKLHIVQTVAGNWVRATALNDATTIMQDHPHLKGFFVANGDMALGVQRAIGSSGKQGTVDTIAIIGDTAVIHEVQDGTMASVVEQFPYVIGEMGVQACAAAAEGKHLPSSVATPAQVIIRANAAKALAAFPKPFEAFKDPFSSLVSGS